MFLVVETKEETTPRVFQRGEFGARR